MSYKIYLAVDQSTSISGYAVFKDEELIERGKVSFEGSPIERMIEIKNWLLEKVEELKEKYSDSELLVILEDIQYQPYYEKTNYANQGVIQNAMTFKTLAQLQGILIAALVENSIPYKTYFSSSWKSTFGIKGKSRAEQKNNAKQYIKETMNIDKITQDECDAILLGLHAVKKDNEEINWD